MVGFVFTKCYLLGHRFLTKHALYIVENANLGREPKRPDPSIAGYTGDFGVIVPGLTEPAVPA